MGETKEKRNLAIYPFNQKLPTIYDLTIDFFQKNYNLKYFTRRWSKFYKLKENIFVRKTYYSIIDFIRKHLDSNFLIRAKVEPKEDFLFCFNRLPPERYDFIIEIETVVGFSDYDYSKLNKRYISERLKSEKCKGILCWNEAAKRELIETIDCSKFKDKIKIIPFGGENFKLEKNKKEKINFLFVSSINNPESFETKGGIIALETWKELIKKNKNIRFIIRANIKKRLKRKYENLKGIRFIDSYLSNEKMKELFQNSDILLVPIPGIDLFRKAMEFGIPSICLDYGVAYEIVRDGETGFLIDGSILFRDRKNVQALHDNEPKYYSKLSEKKECIKFVPGFVEKAKVLINNRKLIEKMSKNQHSLIETKGKYSLKKRNEELKKLIDEYI